MPDWYAEVSPEIQSALSLAGLGGSVRANADVLRRWYPDMSLGAARRLASQADLAVGAGQEVQHETLRGSLGPCVSISFAGIPAGIMYVDAEISYRDPRTGTENRRLMRATLPVGSSYGDVQNEAESFVAWLDTRYGLPVAPSDVSIRYVAVLCGE